MVIIDLLNIKFIIMNLKKIIKYLKIIQKIHGDDMKVIMADFIPVVEPILLNSHNGELYVVMTDKK